MKMTENTQKNGILVLSCLVLGGLVGLSSAGLSLILDFVEKLFLNFEETALRPAAVGTLSVHRLLSVFIGGIIAAGIWWFLREKCSPTVSISSALTGKQMPGKVTAVHVITQIFYVGTGGSVGRELAPREAGAMIAQKWQKLLTKFHLAELPKEDVQLLIAAAAGAGFAGVYIAPITGMLFCIEILVKKISIKTVSVSLSMSIIAMLIGATVKGFNPYYLVADGKFSLSILFLSVLIAPLCGFIGAWFRKSFKWAENNQTKSRAILWQLPLIALITGVISMSFPQIMGNGRALAQLSMNAKGHNLILLLLLGAVLKATVTVFTIRSGASGGTLTPSIAIGGSLGAIIAIVLSNFIPGLNIAQVAILGACAMLAATQQAPLMAMFMMVEIIHLDYSAFLPLGLAVVLSVLVSKMTLKKIS